MVKNIVDNSLPKMYDTEDKIFNFCDVEIEEFTQFITNIKDIEGPFHRRYLSDDFKDLILDHVWLMKNGDLVHVEHHTRVSGKSKRRNFQYVATLHNASNRLIHPFLFNTGPIPKTELEFASPTSFYNPTYVNTQEIEESVRFNNIRYKIDNDEEINVFDVLDLIWIPKYRSNRKTEDIVIDLVDVYSKIIVDEHLLEVLRKSLVLWCGKFVLDENNVKKVTRGLNMSAQEIIDLRRDIVNARIDGMLCRAEEAGMEVGRQEGMEAGKLETARNMLKKGFSIDDIVEITGLAREDVLNCE